MAKRNDTTGSFRKKDLKLCEELKKKNNVLMKNPKTAKVHVNINPHGKHTEREANINLT